MTRGCKNFVKGMKFYKEENYTKAFETFLKSAQRGYVFSQYMVGEMLMKGTGIEMNEEEAVKWLTKASKNGSALANCLLGKVYLYGWGVNQNKITALKYFSLSAEEGCSEGEYQLGRAYIDEAPEIPVDYEEMEYWLERAASKGHISAQYDLGALHTWTKSERLDYMVALKWFMNAASNGDIEAQSTVSKYYRCGFGIEKNEDEAKKWIISHEQRKLELVYEDKEKIEEYLKSKDWYNLQIVEQNTVRMVFN
jgi:uncharacterized protein